MRKRHAPWLAIVLSGFAVSGNACVIDLVNMGSIHANANVGPVVVSSSPLAGVPAPPPNLAKLNIRNCHLRSYRVRMVGQSNPGADFNSETGDSIRLTPFGVSQGRVFALTDFNGDRLHGNATVDVFFHATRSKGLRQGQYTGSLLFELSEQ